MKKDIMISKPIQLDHPRAWRTYLGGQMLNRLHKDVVTDNPITKTEYTTDEATADGHFPEEWIMSVVTARNAGREAFVKEGLSRLYHMPEFTLKEVLEAHPTELLGKSHVDRYGAHPGVLVKLIDSAERLTIQVHPNKQMAKQLFHSEYGKTECWHILDGREIDGKKPGVYLGFKEGITKEKWKALFDKQDIPGMLDCLHYFQIEAGDTILIEGGVPHAIGAGCFLIEIQEPTDYSIRVERTTPNGYKVADEMCHQGIGFENMFECFHYEGLTRNEVKKRWFLPGKTSLTDDGSHIKQLVSYEDTPFFSMQEIRVMDSVKLPQNSFSGLYILEGKGVLCTGDNSIMELQAPAQYFLPAHTDQLLIQAKEDVPLRIIQFFGPCS